MSMFRLCMRNELVWTDMVYCMTVYVVGVCCVCACMSLKFYEDVSIVPINIITAE